MKGPDEKRKHLLTAVAIIGGGGVVVFVLAHAAGAGAPSSVPARGSGRGAPPASSRSPSTHSLNFAPNPANPQLEESILAARSSAVNTYDQSAVAERSAEEQYLLGQHQVAAAQAVAFNQTAAQLKETGMTTTAAEQIAQEEASAQQAIAQAQATAAEQVAQTQAQPALTQAQGSWWQSILGGIGSILPFLGL